MGVAHYVLLTYESVRKLCVHVGRGAVVYGAVYQVDVAPVGVGIRVRYAWTELTSTYPR